MHRKKKRVPEYKSGAERSPRPSKRKKKEEEGGSKRNLSARNQIYLGGIRGKKKRVQGREPPPGKGKKFVGGKGGF